MPGCIQPMSSPIMKRMLGLPAGACAIAGKHNPSKATLETSRLPNRRLIFMFEILRLRVFDRAIGQRFSDCLCRVWQQVVALRLRPPPRLSASLSIRRFSTGCIAHAMRFRQIDIFDRFSSERGRGHFPEDGAVGHSEAPRLPELI